VKQDLLRGAKEPGGEFGFDGSSCTGQAEHESSADQFLQRDLLPFRWQHAAHHGLDPLLDVALRYRMIVRRNLGCGRFQNQQDCSLGGFRVSALQLEVAEKSFARLSPRVVAGPQVSMRFGSTSDVPAVACSTARRITSLMLAPTFRIVCRLGASQWHDGPGGERQAWGRRSPYPLPSPHAHRYFATSAMSRRKSNETSTISQRPFAVAIGADLSHQGVPDEQIGHDGRIDPSRPLRRRSHDPTQQSQAVQGPTGG
jgi:hypothetical protein